MIKYCPKCGAPSAFREIDGVERTVCSSDNCNFVLWDNPVPVVAALVKHNDSYIVARNARWPKGIFSVITGYLEKNETPEQAVIREVFEELGLTGKIHRYIGHYSFYEKNQLILCFEVHASGTLVTNHELAETRYLAPDELSEYDFSPLYITKNIIRDWHNPNQ
jgi:NADH pyrophosphatase NudC (nudix superfamily)